MFEDAASGPAVASSPLLKTIQTVQTPSQLAWSRLSAHLQQWFYQPDLEALQIVYAAVASHYLLSTEPVWPLVIAPPSSGKTSIAVGPLLALEGSHLIGALTPKTLLSGRKDRSSSLLHRIGSSGFMVMKDFGTILSLRDADRAEILSQFREVYDGEFGRQGGSGHVAPWKGKITVVAAATQAVDRAWAFQHDLGERFTNIRWRSAYSREAGRFACRQSNSEREVKDETRRLVRALFDARPLTLPASLSDAQSDRVVDLATFVAHMRATVVRDSMGKREIIEIGQPEGITRLHKTFSLLARFHASMFGSPNAIAESDMAILTRVAIDAIRPARWNFIRHIPLDGEINRGDLHQASQIPLGSINWVGDELVSLGLVLSYSEAEAGYALSTVFRSILQAILGPFQKP
jgi:hypothetical protein